MTDWNGQVGTGHWRDLSEAMRYYGQLADLLCVDAPYSDRTHRGSKTSRNDGAAAQDLDYAHWTPSDVDAFVDAFAPLTTGWFVSLTDHVLWPAWEAAMARHGRYVFSPLVCVEPGGQVRVRGDGPSQWAVFACVSRPKSKAFASWGTLPGAYITPPGKTRTHGSERKREVQGGKSFWLMEQIVCDYSRPGDTVVDPCVGGGTTLCAALRHGRKTYGSDIDSDHAEIAREAIQAETSLSTIKAIRTGQASLFG